MIGQSILHYRIREKLGEGPLGEVYLAHDTQLDRKVALKLLPAELDHSPEARAGLTREARAAAGLHHPNIVQVYSVGEHAGRTYIATEFVDGPSLAERLAEGTVPREEALSVALQICHGLEEAHRHGVLHGDLKPADVLVGRNGRVRLVDLGLARGLEEGPPPGVEQDLAAVGRILARLFLDEPDPALAGLIARAQRTDGQGYRAAESLAGDLEAFLEEKDRPLAAGPARGPRVAVAVLGLVAVVAVALLLLRDRPPAEPGDDPPELESVLVLPFDNLGAPDDEYFADGITDEIITRLSSLQDLAVVSRTSSRQYKDSDKTLRQIADELGVDYVVEGTIRWDRSGAGRVRVTPQLTRTDDETVLWAESYDRDLDGIFAVQADIATRVADALDVNLLEEERALVTARPTDNVDAYQAYLRGTELAWDPDFSEDSFAVAIQMFERAVDLDPGFAQAHARLGTAHARMVHFGFDRSEARLQRARASIDRAFALQPDLTEAHLAQGYFHYWGRRDYERALDAFQQARRLRPGSAEILQALGYVMRRQGRMEESIAMLEESLELSPLDGTAAVSIGETLGTLRRYREAERAFRRSQAVAPDNAYPYTEIALLHLRWRGDTAAARAALAGMPLTSNTERFRVRYLVSLFERDWDAALAGLAECPYPVIEASIFYYPLSLLEGMVHRLRGDADAARSRFAAARVHLEEQLAEDDTDFRLHAALGLALAGLGEPDAAVRHAERAALLYPLDRDALEAPAIHWDRALAHAMVGNVEPALEGLEQLLSIPSIVSVAWLEADPRWDVLRDRPGFADLLDRHRNAVTP